VGAIIDKLAEFAFPITIVFVVGAGFVGSLISGRARDRCLKGFHGFFVTLETSRGKKVWGRLHVSPTGLELSYLDDYYDGDHIETSFILYKEEFPGKLFLLSRNYDDLSEQEQKKRLAILDKSYKPSFFRRTRRRLTNTVSTVKDSLTKALNMLLGQAKKRGGMAGAVLSTQEKEASVLGHMVVGYVGTSYEPLLERRVGSKIVVEITRGDETTEHVGVLKEYSSDFLEIMDIVFTDRDVVRVEQGKTVERQRGVICSLDAGTLKVRNEGTAPFTVDKIVASDEIPAGVELGPGEEHQWALSSADQPVEVDYVSERHADIVVPRAHAIVRHQSERVESLQLGKLLNR